MKRRLHPYWLVVAMSILFGIGIGAPMPKEVGLIALGFATLLAIAMPTKEGPRR